MTTPNQQQAKTCGECRNEFCRIDHVAGAGLPIIQSHLEDTCHINCGGVHGHPAKPCATCGGSGAVTTGTFSVGSVGEQGQDVSLPEKSPCPDCTPAQPRQERGTARERKSYCVEPDEGDSFGSINHIIKIEQKAKTEAVNLFPSDMVQQNQYRLDAISFLVGEAQLRERAAKVAALGEQSEKFIKLMEDELNRQCQIILNTEEKDKSPLAKGMMDLLRSSLKSWTEVVASARALTPSE